MALRAVHGASRLDYGPDETIERWWSGCRADKRHLSRVSASNRVPTDQPLGVGALDALDAIQKCTEEKVGVHRNQLGVVHLREMRPQLDRKSTRLNSSHVS